jgi:voltage-gated potassium channel
VGPAGILISEESRFRTRWDVFVVLLVIVTGIAIPLQITFVREVTLGGSVLVYLLDLVFLVDIGLNFRTTYRAGGAEVRDPGRIGARYRRSLLPLDVVSTVPLDMLLLGSGAVIGGVPAVLLLRALRLLRIVRLFSIVRRWERLRWTNTGYLRIAKLVLGVFLLIHWIACGWFLVAVLEGFPENSWVVLAGIHDLDAGSQYLRSLYWGFVTTTTVGYGDITPHRNLEYAFTVLVMVLGASMYALIIGSIASLVSSVDSAKSGFWNRVDGLNQYLRTRDLPPELYDQIQDYHDYIWDRYRGVSAKEFLSDLPDSLRLEVLFHLTSDLIDRVPLFRHAGAGTAGVRSRQPCRAGGGAGKRHLFRESRTADDCFRGWDSKPRRPGTRGLLRRPVATPGGETDRIGWGRDGPHRFKPSPTATSCTCRLPSSTASRTSTVNFVISSRPFPPRSRRSLPRSYWMAVCFRANP